MEYEVAHFKSPNHKYLYLLFLNEEIHTERKFLKLFPKAINISEEEFDFIHNHEHAEVIPVGDDETINELMDYLDAEGSEKDNNSIIIP